MAIQISSSTVIDNSRNLTCVVTACADQLGGNWIATQAEAEDGTDNTQAMTPLRVSQAITKRTLTSTETNMKDSDINWSACNVGCAVRGGGNVIYKSGGIIWIAAPSTSQVANETWPIGYCTTGGGSSPNRAQRITGRSGWFIPDLGMLQTAYTCRAYWDTFSTSCAYWSAGECNRQYAWMVYFSNGTTASRIKNSGFTFSRPFRVVCY